MECNKEEALRAKDIALKKMEAKDFLGARKLALKAQQLYNDVENISQILCVCDVHCAASKMIGNDLDWYGILQIEQTADDTIIKKQYRKFALLLHPDKNKFAGAEAAFKFIGEAQRLLLDKEKRQLYDMKCRTSSKLVRHQPPQQASRSVGVTKTTRVQNNVSSHHVNFANQFPNVNNQSGASFNGTGTFWTQCPFCSVRYQYFKEVSNRALRCQNCKKPFIAYDMLASGSRPGSDSTQPVFPGKNTPNNVFGSKAGPEGIKKNAEPRQSQKAKQQHKARNKVDAEVERGSKPSMKVNSKRGKKYEEESSESFGSESSLESEDVEFEADFSHQFSSDGDHSTRRSSRNKRKVSYNENVSDDEQITNPSKKEKASEPCDPPTKVDASEKSPKPFVSSSREGNEGKSNYSNGNETVNDSDERSFEVNDYDYKAEPEPAIYELPDPEFSDFDKLREEKCFKVGQLWAAYDNTDAMPRFYAKIRKIYSPGFKVRITWLEPNPDDELGVEWINAELPFGCGKFKHGGSEDTGDRLMFSHEVIWKKGGGRDSVLIYPRKGEIWALFKDWDVKWISNSENDRTFFKYDFVEILSEFDETTGIIVALLGKLKGFTSLFSRKNGIVLKIMPLEILKFSHRVPSTRMSGNERNGVPKDSFELDPASITFNVEEISLP